MVAESSRKRGNGQYEQPLDGRNYLKGKAQGQTGQNDIRNGNRRVNNDSKISSQGDTERNRQGKLHSRVKMSKFWTCVL